MNWVALLMIAIISTAVGLHAGQLRYRELVAKRKLRESQDTLLAETLLRAEPDKLRRALLRPDDGGDWCVRELAEAHRAAHAAGLRDVRDRIERVLEDIDPTWRLYV